MNRNRPGCLSPLALVSALVTLITLGILIINSGSSLFSPGQLNHQSGDSLGGVASHAETGKNCAACHAAPWSSETMSDRCLSCHAAIKDDLLAASTLHGAVFAQDPARKCMNCHPEHRGASASLTEVNNFTFPHEVVGFALTGHQRHPDGVLFTCTDCHSDSIAIFNVQTCEHCHSEIDIQFTTTHLADYGEGCLQCHDGVDRYGQFDHNQLKFALVGAHTQAACSGCHLNPRSAADFQNTPQVCVSCHLADDPHDGEFGGDCGGCHSAEGWSPAQFDHNLASFPLDGAHLELACVKCHQNRTYRSTPTECAACHNEPAFHASLFVGLNCSTCHSTAGWRPARYDQPHAFPMNHGEQNIFCTNCHPSNLAEWTCYTCHEQTEVAQEHQKEGIANFNDCLRCHASGQKEKKGD